MLFFAFKLIFIMMFLLFSVAYFTLLERKMLGGMQRRKGPSMVGFCGLFQPFSDGLKLLAKETVLPGASNIIIFVFAPMLTFVFSFMGWVVMPFYKSVVISDMSMGMLYLFTVSSLGVYGMMMSGWSSNSKYAFLGSLRSAAQMISYEMSMGLIVMLVLICSGSLNLTFFVESQVSGWYFIPLFPASVMFFVSVLAETNSTPFDLPEAEAELVAGYSVEYSAVGFVLFFIAEYLNMMLMSILFIILFLGGWLPYIFMFVLCSSLFWVGMKLVMTLYLFVWISASLPRYSYDQLMSLGWKVFLPISLGWVVFMMGMLLTFDMGVNYI